MATRVILFGDKDSAVNLRKPALNQLEILRQQMLHQNLKQGERVLKFDNGTIIQCTSVFGFEQVNIYVPPVENPKKIIPPELLALIHTRLKCYTLGIFKWSWIIPNYDQSIITLLIENGIPYAVSGNVLAFANDAAYSTATSNVVKLFEVTPPFSTIYGGEPMPEGFELPTFTLRLVERSYKYLEFPDGVYTDEYGISYDTALALGNTFCHVAQVDNIIYGVDASNYSSSASTIRLYTIIKDGIARLAAVYDKVTHTGNYDDMHSAYGSCALCDTSDPDIIECENVSPDVANYTIKSNSVIAATITGTAGDTYTAQTWRYKMRNPVYATNVPELPYVEKFIITYDSDKVITGITPTTIAQTPNTAYFGGYTMLGDAFWYGKDNVYPDATTESEDPLGAFMPGIGYERDRKYSLILNTAYPYITVYFSASRQQQKAQHAIYNYTQQNGGHGWDERQCAYCDGATERFGICYGYDHLGNQVGCFGWDAPITGSAEDVSGMWTCNTSQSQIRTLYFPNPFHPISTVALLAVANGDYSRSASMVEEFDVLYVQQNIRSATVKNVCCSHMECPSENCLSYGGESIYYYYGCGYSYGEASSPFTSTDVGTTIPSGTGVLPDPSSPVKTQYNPYGGTGELTDELPTIYNDCTPGFPGCGFAGWSQVNSSGGSTQKELCVQDLPQTGTIGVSTRNTSFGPSVGGGLDDYKLMLDVSTCGSYDNLRFPVPNAPDYTGDLKYYLSHVNSRLLVQYLEDTSCSYSLGEVLFVKICKLGFVHSASTPLVQQHLFVNGNDITADAQAATEELWKDEVEAYLTSVPSATKEQMMLGRFSME